MWDLIVSVPDHCLSFYFSGILMEFHNKYVVIIVCFHLDNISSRQRQIAPIGIN